MRWIWIDKIIEFESGRRAKAIKNVTLAEDHLHDHFAGNPVMPNSLIIEGLAQTGGMLVGEHSGFTASVVLAKVPRAEFHLPVVPGDTLTYTVNVEYIKNDGAMVSATSHIGDRLQAEMEIIFAQIRDNGTTSRTFKPESPAFTMKLLGVFDVDKIVDGRFVSDDL
jgi:3-hydroxyacyl-[acyl-carrier-protein] dehydratase